MAGLKSMLVVGGGGREVALMREGLEAGVKTFSTRSEEAVNFGIEDVINTGLGDKDIEGIASWAAQEKIGLVAIGPEAPLIDGLADRLRSKKVPTFGPGADGAKFEAHKGYTHRLVEKTEGLHNPPNSATFTPDQREDAKQLVRDLDNEAYTKRVGQEGGKGAKKHDSEDEAFAEIDAVADKGEDLVIQGHLGGPEYSGTFILDGVGGLVATSLSRDHKSLFAGGIGPNTGGMGAYAPLTLEHASMQRRDHIAEMAQVTAQALRAEGIDYRGVLYAGLMAADKSPDSQLYVLEWNVRFGDPETQVILPSMGGLAIAYMEAAAHGEIGEVYLDNLYMSPENEDVSLTVCLASPGYAEEGKKPTIGLPIHVPKILPDDVTLEFAGAEMRDGVPTSTGGRVVYVTKKAESLAKARKVYDVIGRENGGIYIGDDQQVIREDIGEAA